MEISHHLTLLMLILFLGSFWSKFWWLSNHAESRGKRPTGWKNISKITKKGNSSVLYNDHANMIWGSFWPIFYAIFNSAKCEKISTQVGKIWIWIKCRYISKKGKVSPPYTYHSDMLLESFCSNFRGFLTVFFP